LAGDAYKPTDPVDSDGSIDRADRPRLCAARLLEVRRDLEGARFGRSVDRPLIVYRLE
jgi:hypothetical protein